MSVNSLEKCFAKSPVMVYRRIADECFIVPIHKDVADMQSIYVLNETAGRIWELLDGTRKIQEVRDIILTEFETGPDEVEADLEVFLQHLKEIGGVIEVL